MLNIIKLAFIAGSIAGLAGGTAIVLSSQGIYGVFRRGAEKRAARRTAAEIAEENRLGALDTVAAFRELGARDIEDLVPEGPVEDEG